jgi:hypothetical protein
LGLKCKLSYRGLVVGLNRWLEVCLKKTRPSCMRDSSMLKSKSGGLVREKLANI